ncbi:MAG: hypothetical protein Q4C90_01820 [Kocuria sp.]|uniref:hypothetical protein n=1 Tax=Kocuria TaxID=57493 RepID=UPI0026DBA3F0|nr:hypothetical protein [Kocuria sp.]MDO4255899.1 hypothetical protein [Kocuria sp.]
MIKKTLALAFATVTLTTLGVSPAQAVTSGRMAPSPTVLNPVGTPSLCRLVPMICR